MRTPEVQKLVTNIAIEATGVLRKAMYGHPLPLSAEKIITDAAARILTAGHDQYAEVDHHKFEVMPLDQLVDYVEEESLDLINYGVFVTHRVRLLKVAIRGLERRKLDLECAVNSDLPAVSAMVDEGGPA